MLASRSRTSSPTKTVNVASSGFVVAIETSTPPNCCSSTSATAPTTAPAHIRRIATPLKNRNKSTRVSVSMKNPTINAVTRSATETEIGPLPSRHQSGFANSWDISIRSGSFRRLARLRGVSAGSRRFATRGPNVDLWSA